MGDTHYISKIWHIWWWRGLFSSLSLRGKIWCKILWSNLCTSTQTRNLLQKSICILGQANISNRNGFDKKIYQKHSKNVFQLYRIQTKEIHLIEIGIVCISNDSHVNPPLKWYKRCKQGKLWNKRYNRKIPFYARLTKNFFEEYRRNTIHHLKLRCSISWSHFL